MGELTRPCKVWTGRLAGAGYGVYTMDGVEYYVHRLTWEMANGRIPPRGYICHRCDNPPCYELTHLFLGTPKDNVRDMIAKGRQYPGRKTHCINGHLYDEANTYLYRGYRRCRACLAAREQQRH